MSTLDSHGGLGQTALPMRRRGGRREKAHEEEGWSEKVEVGNEGGIGK